MNVDVAGALSALAAHRPVFHSERDFQHALAWQIQLAQPQVQIRLETRPRRGVHLDLLIMLDGMRTAIELKYLLAGLYASVGGELFDLPHHSANDISRHDVVKDITRVEAILADGYADHGCVLVLSNDRSYWQPPLRADSIDAAFRLHEGRVLQGTLTWATRAGAGTTKGRDTPLHLAGRHTCRWHDYSQVSLPQGQTAVFRYLLITATADPNSSHPASAAPTPGTGHEAGPPAGLPHLPRAPYPADSARQEILTAARTLATRSPDGSFTLLQVIAELRRTGTRYAESTIRTHVDLADVRRLPRPSRHHLRRPRAPRPRPLPPAANLIIRTGPVAAPGAQANTPRQSRNGSLYLSARSPTRRGFSSPDRAVLRECGSANSVQASAGRVGLTTPEGRSRRII